MTEEGWVFLEEEGRVFLEEGRILLKKGWVLPEEIKDLAGRGMCFTGRRLGTDSDRLAVVGGELGLAGGGVRFVLRQCTLRKVPYSIIN